MRVLFTTLGSEGDLFPYLAIARELAARGHEAAFATNEAFRAQIEERGFAFHLLRPELKRNDPEVVERVNRPVRGPLAALRELFITSLRESYEDTLAAARDADAIVTHPITIAGPIVAEVTGLPWISTGLAPIAFASRKELPALPMGLRLDRIAALPGAAAAVRWLFHLGLRPVRKHVRELRAELGLKMRRPGRLQGASHSPLLSLGLFSAAFARPRSDWPESARLTGFPFDELLPDEDDERRLRAFLEAGPPPVVFTLGTWHVRRAGSFYVESLAAARSLGVRAVLLVGDDPRHRTLELDEDEAIALVRYPFHALFPHALAIVHHGGIGTTGQALRSGRPALIAPRTHDQPDNAARAERHGVARTLHAPRRYRARAVARELSALFADPSYAERAEAMGAVVRSEDGAGAACEAILEAARKG